MIPTDYLQEALHRYCGSHSNNTPEYLDVIERMTNLNTLAPQMLSGKLQGRLLSLLSKLQSPRIAIEIGTFTGYSALCLAEGLAADGILHTIEVDNQYDVIIDYIKSEIKLSQKIKFHKKDALELIPKLEAPFDLVFIDASKNDYLNYLKLVEPKMKLGSMLISDNILWSGKVLNESKDKETEVLDQYNKYLYNSPLWEVMLLPFRDGLSIAKKIS